MRIMSIQSTNFKGLWGKPIVDHNENVHSDSAQMLDYGTITTKTTNLYHPFADEKQEEIDKIVKENTYHNTRRTRQEDINYAVTHGYWADDIETIDDSKVEVMPKLSFTAAEFAAYQAKELLSKAEMALEDALKIAKLQKYLRR